MKNNLLQKLAKVLIDHSLELKPDDRLVLSSSDTTSIELLHACYEKALERESRVFIDIAGLNLLFDRCSLGSLSHTFYRTASNRQIDSPPEIYADIVEWGNKFLRIITIDDPEYLDPIDTELIERKLKSTNTIFQNMLKKRWVLTYPPTQIMADNAGISLSEFNKIYLRASLIDYKQLATEMKLVERILDNGKHIRIVGDKTDLKLDLTGRSAQICAGRINIPDGEIYTGPVEKGTEGTIFFEGTHEYLGRKMTDILLEFSKGRIAKASCKKGQKELNQIIAIDDGARRVGEFGIGTNKEIDRFLHHGLFDEKIGGTIHIALGDSYTTEKGWGLNKSSIHWDIVKNTRKKGCFVEVDGKKMLESGEFL